MKYALRVVWFMVVPLIHGCGLGSLPESTAAPEQAGKGLGENRVAPMDQEEPGEPITRSPDQGPLIESIDLHPDPPVSQAAFRVEPIVDNPAAGPLHLDYEWMVNGREVMGVFGDTLRPDKFKAGDTLAVTVMARDRRGKVDTATVTGIQVSNSTPQIVSNLATMPNLDGYAFEAVDPDGDPVTWRLEGAPPGMTIGERSGRIALDTSKVYKNETYTIEVVAMDPSGGEGRLKFSASLGGAAQARTDVVTIEDGKLVSAETYSDEEYIAAAERHFEKIDGMTPEELEAYLERRLQTGEEMEEIGAVELPVGAPPPPYGSED